MKYYLILFYFSQIENKNEKYKLIKQNIYKLKNEITCTIFCLHIQTKPELTSEFYRLNNKLIKHRERIESPLKLLTRRLNLDEVMRNL